MSEISHHAGSFAREFYHYTDDARALVARTGELTDAELTTIETGKRIALPPPPGTPPLWVSAKSPEAAAIFAKRTSLCAPNPALPCSP